MSDRPPSYRDDVLPEKNPSSPEKKKGESFNTAHNPPNNPTKNHRPESFNVNDDYNCDCDPGDED